MSADSSGTNSYLFPVKSSKDISLYDVARLDSTFLDPKDNLQYETSDSGETSLVYTDTKVPLTLDFQIGSIAKDYIAKTTQYTASLALKKGA